mgnify:CR=1 FL=1
MNDFLKIKLLKIVLFIGAGYYLVGGVVHYFGLTLFPWYDGRLYAPYHDTIIALVCLVFVMMLLAVAHDPVKNIDILKVIIVSVAIGSIVSIAVIWKVDFAVLGAPAKKLQTVVEGMLGFIYLGMLLWLYPKNI